MSGIGTLRVKKHFLFTLILSYHSFKQHLNMLSIYPQKRFGEEGRTSIWLTLMLYQFHSFLKSINMSSKYIHRTSAVLLNLLVYLYCLFFFSSFLYFAFSLSWNNKLNFIKEFENNDNHTPCFKMLMSRKLKELRPHIK